MTECCDTECGLDATAHGQRTTLRIVLGINAVMFLVIVGAAFAGSSSSLFADSLDNLGDALTYGFSLFAVAKGAEAKARVAMLKAGLIFAAAIGVIIQIAYKLAVPALPNYEIMGVFSIAGLAANGVCLLLLTRHRHEDINMSSVWECSRNDIASNVSVFVAAFGVWLAGSGWPDILVGAALVVLLMRSAVRVSLSAMASLRPANQ